MNIATLFCRQILDSRGNPTVEVEIKLENGIVGRASVPSGASTGSHEAVELRDGGHDFGGMGVQNALDNIRELINPYIIGMPAENQKAIDDLLTSQDGTENKSRLGANATLAVSLAAAHAAANSLQVPLYQHIGKLGGQDQFSLPMPMMNLLNGGRHAMNSSDIQENMIIPIGAEDITSAIRIGSEIFSSLKELLVNSKLPATVGDEGGFAPPLDSNLASLDLLTKAVQNSGYMVGRDIAFAVDVAANELHEDSTYNLLTDKLKLNSEQLIDWYKKNLLPRGVVSIEDGLAEDDWENWVKLTSTLPDIQLVGDDLLVTNPQRLAKAIASKAANAILIKPNQIGTLSETIDVIKQAQSAGYKTIVSHRSGETEDVSIVHLAVGMNSGQIKTGSLSRGERTAKYNELLRLSEDPNLKLANPFK